jgi:DNA-binding LacI/PurR family transcriptional regulator
MNLNVTGSPPTQHDVAKLAKVSQSAVSRVLSGGYVSAKTRERIRKACETLGYVPDLGARALVTGSSNMIAVIVANITNPFYPFILDRLTMRIQQSGREVLLLNASGGRDIDELLPIVLQYKVRSVVIMTASLSSKMANRLLEHQIPAVMLNRYSTVGSGNSVACDNLEGGRVVADAFVKAGFTSFGYVGGSPASSTNLDRRNGFIKGLAASGHQPLFALDGEFNHEWGYEAGNMLRHFPQVQSIFCADDVIAMGIMDSMKEAGRSAPDDISVVGFDDIPSAGWAAYSLSTVQQPVDAMIDHTLKILNNGISSEPAEVRIPGKLIIRSSFRGNVEK